MLFKPRHIDDLAEEVGGLAKVKALLRDSEPTKQCPVPALEAQDRTFDLPKEDP